MTEKNFLNDEKPFKCRKPLIDENKILSDEKILLKCRKLCLSDGKTLFAV